MSPPLHVVGQSGRAQRRRGPPHRSNALHHRPHVPRDAHAQDRPQPVAPRTSCAASTCRRPSACPASSRALTAEDVPHNVYTILGLIGVEPEEEFVLTPVGERVRYLRRADRRDPGRDGGRPRTTRSPPFASTSMSCPPSSTSRRPWRPDAPVVTHWGNNTFMYEGHPCRRVRFGDVEAAFAHGRPHRRARLQHQAHRARTDRDDRRHRRARGERPLHRLHQHAGALLQPRQHRDHPAGSRAAGSISSAARSAAASAARST